MPHLPYGSSRQNIDNTTNSNTLAIKVSNKRPLHSSTEISDDYMDPSLQEVWAAAAANPFKPFIGKDEHFFLGFALLSLGILLCGYFGMSMHIGSFFYMNGMLTD